jgi:quinol monooxygenase YgiN
MSAPVLIGFAGVLVAAVVTGMLAGRCFRQPRLDLILWAASTLGLTVALAAQAKGFASGFNPATFRAIQLFAVLLAPLWLGWGLVERVAESEAARFGMRLLCSALTVVSGVILATDPLTSQAFGKSWPVADQHYQPISAYVLDLVQVVAVIAAAAAAGLAAARARHDRRWLAALAGIGPVALAVLVTAALRFSLPSRSLYPLLSMIAAALVWFGATRLTAVAGMTGRAGPGRAGPGRAGRSRDARRGAGARARARADRGAYRSDGPGVLGEYPDADPGVRYRSDGSGEYPDADPGVRERAPRRGKRDRGAAAGDFAPEAGVLAADGHPRPPGVPGPYAPVPQGPDLRAPGLQQAQGIGDPAATAAFAGAAAAGPFGGPARGTTTARPVAPPAPLGPPAPLAPLGPPALSASPEGTGKPTAKPYGRILIFTLLDDRVADFDRLAEQTAEEVMTSEPDTLVYVIHLVPNAPMQRIFYEIYRDRAAFEQHESQPYMQRFVADRRSLVLATNVIELRLKFAKVAPLPSPAPDPALPAAPRAQLPPGPGWGPPVPQGLQPPVLPSLQPPVPQSLQPLPPARTQRRHGGG